jgi:hypothetical protein
MLLNSVTMKKKLSIIVALILIMTTGYSQEEEKKETKDEGLKGTHRLTLVIGHSHVFAGIKENGKKGFKIFPSWGFDYDYWVSNRLAIGVQTDMVVETFEVENHENTVIERTRPVTTVAAAIFKAGKSIGLIAGMGGEFAHEGNFAVTRLGAEAGWEMKNNWEFGVSLVYDIKWNGYDSGGIGFGITKLLRKQK